MNINKSTFQSSDGNQMVAETIYQTHNTYHQQTACINRKRCPIELPYYYHLQPPVNNFCGRNIELRKIHQLLNRKSAAILSQAVTIAGLGGVGKTETAKAYAIRYRKHYKIIFFIVGDTPSVLANTFHEIAEEFKIDIKTKPIKDIVNRLYKYCSYYGKTLVIMDNVDNHQDVLDYLPKEHHSKNKPKILITSRNHEWDLHDYGKIETLKLDKFTSETAKEFICKSLNAQNYTDLDIVRLCETFHYLPLAIKQAVDYIKAESSVLEPLGKKYTIDDYLKIFNSRASKLMACQTTTDIYKFTVMTTWRTTVDKIKEKSDLGKRAIEILEFIAYLTADDIPSIIFNVEEDSLSAQAISCLNKYSIIDIKDGRINIHRLIQCVIRIDVKNSGREEYVIGNVLKLLNEYYNTVNVIQHLITVWSYACEYQHALKDYYKDITYIPLQLITSQEKCDMKVFEILLDYEFSNGNLQPTTLYRMSFFFENFDVIEYCQNFYKQNKIEHNINDFIFSRIRYNPNNDLFKKFLSSKCDLNERDSNGKTFLMHCCHYEAIDSKVMKYLVKNHTIDLELADRNGETVLFHACSEYRMDLIRYLIDSGCDVNRQNITGCSAIVIACQRGFVKMVKTFLKSGKCDLNLKDDNGKTLLMHACLKLNVKIVKIIARKNKYHLNGNIQDNNGNTALHLMIFNYVYMKENFIYYKILNTLIKYGCDPCIRNNDGHDVFDISNMLGDVKTIMILNKFIKRKNRKSIFEILKPK